VTRGVPDVVSLVFASSEALATAKAGPDAVDLSADALLSIRNKTFRLTEIDEDGVDGDTVCYVGLHSLRAYDPDY
jgi:hypothetical protein